MTIRDGMQQKGLRVKIPGTSRAEFPQFLVESGYQLGAEIGVFKGGFLEKLCKAGLKMYGIDPWKTYDDFLNPKGQPRQDFLYEHTQRVVAPYDCTLIRKTSMEAVTDFADGCLDFVYIDGNHAFKYVAEDIFEWAKKVRTGGIVSGHDYVIASSSWSPCHVKYVVDAYVACFRIQNWYLLDAHGLNRPNTVDEERDRTRTWFWVKE